MVLISLQEWKRDFLTHKTKILLAVLLLVIAVILTILSGGYVDEVEAVAVPDLILNNLPVLDLTPIFVWGLLLVLAVYVIYPFLYNPKKIHYSIGMLSLFLMVRSGFLILTHLKIPADAIILERGGFLDFITYSNDLFFSGHAGIPFLGFLIYQSKKIKYFMLVSSIILAFTVLLMHIHYSIDVASAYFITYGVYKLGDKLFGNHLK